MHLLDMFFFSNIIFIIFYFNRVVIFNSSTSCLIIIYVLTCNEICSCHIEPTVIRFYCNNLLISSLLNDDTLGIEKYPTLKKSCFFRNL